MEMKWNSLEVEIARVLHPKVRFVDPCFLFLNVGLAFEFDSPEINISIDIF